MIMDVKSISDNAKEFSNQPHMQQMETDSGLKLLVCFYFPTRKSLPFSTVKICLEDKQLCQVESSHIANDSLSLNEII